MISFLLFLIQFAIDYVMLVVHLYFIIQALVIFTPSTWFRPLHTGGLTSQDVTLLLALCLIIPALLSRFSFFQSILLHVNGARRAKGDDLAYIEACLDPVLQKRAFGAVTLRSISKTRQSSTPMLLATIISSSLRGSLTSFPWTR